MKIKSKKYKETLNFLYSGVKGIYVLDHIAFMERFDNRAKKGWEKSTGKKKLEEWAKENLPKKILERFNVDLPTVEEVFSQKMLNLFRLGRNLKSKQLPIFQNSDNRMMEFDGKIVWWWTRSAYRGYATSVWDVLSTAALDYCYAGFVNGFVPVLREKEGK